MNDQLGDFYVYDDNSQDFDILSNIPGEDIVGIIPDDEIGTRSSLSMDYKPYVKQSKSEVQSEFEKRMVNPQNRVPVNYSLNQNIPTTHVNSYGQVEYAWQSSDRKEGLENKLWPVPPRMDYGYGQLNNNTPMVQSAQARFQRTDTDARQYLTSDDPQKLPIAHQNDNLVTLPMQYGQEWTHQLYGIRELEIPMFHGGSDNNAARQRNEINMTLSDAGVGTDSKYSVAQGHMVPQNMLESSYRAPNEWERPNDNYRYHEMDTFNVLAPRDLGVRDSTQTNREDDTIYSVSDNDSWMP